MNKITLSVDDKNLALVMTLLENLKEGLINDISSNTNRVKSRPTQYQPKTNTIIKEENSGTHDTSGKYANPNIYKQRLKNKNL